MEKAYLKECRTYFENALLAALPQEDESPGVLAEAIRYSVMSGGKRLRPTICLAAAESQGGERRQALPAAIALELLHNYTLVHDDLPCMDNDLLRRGMPTVHAKFGEATAVLTGDALQTMAFEKLAADTSLAAKTIARWVHELARAAGHSGVIGGQSEDIGNEDISEERLIYVHRHKTAALFRAAMRMGVIAVDGTHEARERMGQAGTNLGLAFQIIDDLLDAPASESSPKELNCLQVWSRAEALERARQHSAAATAAIREDNIAARSLRWLIDDLLERSF